MDEVQKASYAGSMKAIRVRVENGRITGVAPPGLPDGEIDLCIAEPDDMEEMTEAEQAELDASLKQSLEDIKAGRYRPAADVLADLRRK